MLFSTSQPGKLLFGFFSFSEGSLVVTACKQQTLLLSQPSFPAPSSVTPTLPCPWKPVTSSGLTARRWKIKATTPLRWLWASTRRGCFGTESLYPTLYPSGRCPVWKVPERPRAVGYQKDILSQNICIGQGVSALPKLFLSRAVWEGFPSHKKCSLCSLRVSPVLNNLCKTTAPSHWN